MKKNKIALISILLMSILILNVSFVKSQAASKTMDNGIYKLVIGKQPNESLEIAGSNKNNNAIIDIWDYGNVPAQQFYFEYDNSGYYKITAMHTRKSLTVKDNDIKSGTSIVQSDYVGSNGQKWVLKDSHKNGWIISPLSNQNLAITVQGNIKNGSRIILSENKVNDNQMLYVYNITSSQQGQSNGIYKMLIGRNSSKAIEIAGSNQNNNAIVDIWDYGNVPAQKFYFEYNKDGYYKITAMHTGKSLTVKDNNIKSGASIVQSDYTGSNGQKWITRDTHKNGWVISPLSNPQLAITIQGNITNGSRMVLSTIQDNNNQMLYLYNISSQDRIISNGDYEMLVGYDSNKSIEIAGSNQNNNAIADIWDYGNVPAQKFKFEYNAGYYKITAKHTGKSLTAKGNNIKSGTEIVQVDYTGSDSQKWIIKDSNKNGLIISPLSNPQLAITIQGTIKNGAKLILSNSTNSNNQMFYLIQAVTAQKTMNNGIYEFAIGANSNKAVEVAGSSTSNNAKVDIWDYGNARAQKFRLEYMNGYYKITAAHTGKSLSVKNNNIKSGVDIVQSDYNGTIGQQWIVLDSKINGWIISPVARPDLAITIQGNITNGSKLVLSAKQRASRNQMFYLFTRNISVDINTAKYPGIADRLDALATSHPNWQFEILYTNINFNTAVNGEYQYANKRGNLVYTPSYNGGWITSDNPFVSGSWASASYNGIAYFMDPRNFLNDTDIFQFLDLGSYSNSGATLSSIQYQVNGTFLQNSASDILNACRSQNINPYYVIARLFQEQGRNGSATINMDGGDGKKYYNPFNIGAVVGNDVATALSKAKSEGWDTLAKGINGGITFLRSNYIGQKQNTLYLNKFDVNPASGGGFYSHQYMQNLSAAYSEARTLRSAYSLTGTLNNKLKFIIPVYENMSSSVSARPQNASSTTSGERVTVKTNDGSGIILRKEPTTSSSIVARISDGTVLIRINKNVKQANGYNWDYVEFNGQRGYAATNFLK